MTARTMYADSSITGTVTTPTAAIGAADLTFTTDTGNTSWTHRWSMGNPTAGDVANGTQTITVSGRKELLQTGTPTLAANLYENGTLIGALFAATNVTSDVSQDIAGTFSPASVSNLNNVEIELVCAAAGGAPGARTSVQIDSITWTGDFLADQAFTVTPNDTEGLTDSLLFVSERSLADTASLSDALQIAIGVARTEDAGLVDAIALEAQASITDAIGLTDVVVRELGRPLAESADLTDVATLLTVFSRAFPETEDLTDTVDTFNAAQSGTWIFDYSTVIGGN